MIEIVEGKGVGAGKSYYAATRIVEHFSRGGTVFASDTFGLKWEEAAAFVERRYGVTPVREQYSVFSEDDVPQLHTVTPQGTDECPVLVIVDECHTKLNARDWADRNKRDFFVWLTQSRHDNNDVMFISQNAHNIDKQVARLVTYIRRARNMATWKIPGLGKWPFKQFIFTTLDSDGKTVLEKQWVKHDKEIFAIYESKVMKGRHKRLGPVIPKHHLAKVTCTNKTMFKPLLIIAPLIIIFCIWKFSNIWSKTTDKAPGGNKTIVDATAPVSAASSSASPVPAKVAGPLTIRAEFIALSGAVAYGVTDAYGVTRNYRDRRSLQTSLGVFMEGEVCMYGMCREVRTPDPTKLFAIARCESPTGTTYVVADKAPPDPVELAGK
jgi:hypothetical protein